jgi:hypothetical protein
VDDGELAVLLERMVERDALLHGEVAFRSRSVLDRSVLELLFGLGDRYALGLAGSVGNLDLLLGAGLADPPACADW